MKLVSISDKLTEWKSEFLQDGDREYLLHGIKHGFRITDKDSKFDAVH